MFQNTEQMLAVAYWMFEHQPEPKSSMAMMIDGLRERFGRNFIEHLPSGLSPYERQAQAVIIACFVQHQLATHPLELVVVQAEFARGQDFVLSLTVLRGQLKPGTDLIEQRVILALLMHMFHHPPSGICGIERLSGLSKNTPHRWDKEWRERVVTLLRQALQRLEEPMAEVGVVCKRQRNFYMKTGFPVLTLWDSKGINSPRLKFL